MKKIFYFITLFAFGFNSVAVCQGTSPVLQNVGSKLKALLINNVIEKTYLQFDKPYYAAGDTMYFKAYVTLGEHHDPSKASGILHVDLVNPNNIIIRSILLELNNGLASGDFALPDTLQNGAYRVRAFTRYMENTPEYFFDETIAVGSVNGSAYANRPQTAKADIQFFPEGGDLITTLVTKVAFKAVGTNGMSIDAKGVVTDNTNVPVASFSSTHLGMGSFYLQPEAGKTYKAKVTFSDGTQSTVDLPPAVAKGITLEVKDTLNKVSVNIVCNKAYFTDNQNKDVDLVIYASGKLRTVNTKLDSRVMGMDIVKNDYPSGLMQITLFSQEGEPLSERLVFLQNADLLNIAVSSSKPTYKTRDRVEVNITAKSNNIGASGYFSAAVVDETRVPYEDNNETTILSYLLLTSDLKGYVEKPNYYFANKTDQAHRDLDNLLLSQGYRRFTWKQLLSTDVKPFTIAPEKSLFLTGTEKNSNGAPVVNKEVLFMSGNSSTVFSAKTDNDGKFLFDNLAPFNDGTSFTLQATGSTKDKNSTVITIDKQPEPPVSESTFSGNLSQLTGGVSGNVQSANGAVNAGNGEQEINGDDLGNAASLTAALNGRLNGVNFVSGIPYLRGVKYPMLIVVDGKIRGSFVKIDNVPLSNVKNVELLKGTNAASYGANGSSGVLVINTRHGSSGIDLNPQNDTYKYESQTVVKVKDTKTMGSQSAAYRSSSLAGPGHADQVILGDALRNATSLSSALNGVLRGVDFVNGVPYVRGASTVGLGGGAQPMYVLVDGVQGNSSVDNINPGSVEAVEVLKGANASIYGTYGGSGVLIITTRTQSDNVETAQSSIGSLPFKPKGFYKAREFYSPKYNASTAANSGPDLRSTIYWNPNLVTDKDGNAAFEFYNSDGHGSYRIIVEGIDGNGNIGWQVYRYKVE